MHIADLSKGMLGANAIVGGSPPIAVGAALTQKYRKTGKVAVAFSGDGASNQGTTFEALNMAVVLGAPAIFIFENNGYGEHTASGYSVGASSIAERVHAFGMPTEVVDGTDFFAVHEAMGRALERGRSGEGPYALEVNCFRFLGHFVGDPQAYRTAEELAQARAGDPLPRFRRGVTEAKILEGAVLDAIEKEVLQEIEEAVEAAHASPFPDVKALEKDVYARY
jgi:pyruvate dehydrogenase E1 component alpha subunit